MRRTQRKVLVGIGVLIAACASGQAPPQPAVGGNPADQTAVRPALVSKVETPARVTAQSAPQPIGYESDVYCFGYLGDYSETFPVKVISAESLAEQINYIAGDLLYVDGGYDKGLRVGDVYWLVTPEQEVFNPVSAKSLGRFYQHRGRAVVYSVE